MGPQRLQDTVAQETPLDLDAWFRLEDYACVSSFGMAEWFIALDVRFDFLMKQEEKSTSDLEELWDRYLVQTRPEGIKSDLANGKHNWVYQISNAIKEVTLEDFPREIKEFTLEDVSTPENNMWIIQRILLLGQRLLLVNLDSSDRVLMQEFKEWLRIVREQAPLPISRRGRKTTNVEVTEQHLRSWTNYKVLACFDIDHWARVLQRSQIPHELLCEKLQGPHYEGNAKEWGREARRTLDTAVNSQIILMSQIPRGMK